MNDRPPQPPALLGNPQRMELRSAQAPQRISVVDFDMPFGRMIVFMIKWAFAAIPALIIIWAIMFFCFLIVMMFFGGIAAVSQHH